MSMTTALLGAPAKAAPTKRQQIFDGARKIFLRDGFDAASVNELALGAGVSKATLYAYFASKEKLFEAMVFDDRRQQAEQVFKFDSHDASVRTYLQQVGLRLSQALLRPETLAYTRMVIAAAAKFPDIGRAFYEAGPSYGVKRVGDFLAERSTAGEISVPDAEIAAHQFLDLCVSGIMKPLLFGATAAPAPETVAARVNEAVVMILARYGTKG